MLPKEILDLSQIALERWVNSMADQWQQEGKLRDKHEEFGFHAYKNESDQVRWSMDIRFQCTDTLNDSGRDQAFVARSARNPAAEETFAQWAPRFGQAVY